MYTQPNPYTWHTVESLNDNWEVLQRCNADREANLEQERRRQYENDNLRKEYAKATKEFYAWLTQTRVDLLDMGSSLIDLKDQLNAARFKLDEIRDADVRFQPIEQLGSQLEDRLVVDNKYTEHTTLGLAQAWDQLDQLGSRMINSLEQQLQVFLRNKIKPCLNTYIIYEYF